MEDNWWPSLIADVASETPWSQPDVVVAEIASTDRGERMVSAALVPMAGLASLAGRLVDVGYRVEANGPRPGPAREPFKPRFWVHGGGEGLRLEPLVLSWEANNHVTHTIDPGFLMTYGLTPRLTGDGAIAYDDQAAPAYDVAKVVGPARYNFPTWTPATITIQRDYLQDYLSLRGCAFVQGFYLKRFGPMDAESDALLGEQDAVELKFADREFQLNRHRRDGQVELLVQVWGGRVAATAGALPISTDLMAGEGLEWPGFEGPVRRDSFRHLRDQWVFVRDEVLGVYEDRPDFDLFPESGAVRFGGQWGVSFCRRVGRDLIELELRKLYEGAPDAVIQHWRSYAIAPPAQVDNHAPNIATRSQKIVESLLALGDALEAFGSRMGRECPAVDYVSLDRAALANNGWWSASTIEPITRHAPMNMTVGDFLGRCVSLDNLISEGLRRSSLRPLCRALGFEDEVTKELGGLKLLDLVARFAAEAVRRAAVLPGEAKDVTASVVGQAPAPRPLRGLFALYDLRNLGSHAGRDETKLADALGRFGKNPAQAIPGYGAILDHIYDAVAEELQSAAEVTAQAIEVG